MSEPRTRKSKAPARGSLPDLGSIPSASTHSAPPHGRSDHACDLAEGLVIAGKYRIEKVIGRGGMGMVYAAKHLALDEMLAIKVLRPSMVDIPEMVVRFLREARAASKIKSPFVARVTDVDTLPSGEPYMVMEYLDGTDLAALRRKSGALPIAEAASHIANACDAIAEAHGLGIVHRDLKPSNLFLARRRDDRQVIKVLDFGISKIESPSEQDTTKPGMMMGSPRYMAPEQMKSIRDADARSDIWSLGAILYELLSGRPAFVADSIVQVCALVIHGEPPRLRSVRPEVPEELEAIVERCLKKLPEERFASADDLARALRPFCPGTDLQDITGPISMRSGDLSPATLRPGGETAPSAQVMSVQLAPPAAVDTPAPKRSRARTVALFAAVGLLGGGALALARVDLARRFAGESFTSQAGGHDEVRPADTAAAAPASAAEPAPVATEVPAAPAPAEDHASADRDAGVAPAASASDGGMKPRAPGSRPSPPSPRQPGASDPFKGSRN